ncbi:hypothetical protein P4B35_14310 [Pontiellaceae bacterium B12227]|nr:hypothetical protein [Pontiellaceae bacterium B12227]
MLPSTKYKQGFTITEVVVSSMIFVMAVGVAMSGYIFSLKNTNSANTQSELDSDVQLAIEMLKKDMRLSSMSLVSYYPAQPPYTAISFPIAYDVDGDGMLERDEKKIKWNDTVIYHVRKGTPNELVRTVFKSRNNNLDQAERFEQLKKVVESGGDNGAQSRVIFENLLNWQLNPRIGQYNGYDDIHTLEEDVFLGYALLDNGDHNITFEAIDAGAEGGYTIGIDQIMATPSSLPQEGESLSHGSEEGASATRVLDRQAKGNFLLNFPAQNAGDKFTVTVHNDKWIETNFEDPEELSHVEVKFDESLTPANLVVQLTGMEAAWNVRNQTGAPTYGTPGIEMKGTVIRQLQKGDSILGGGFIHEEGLRSRVVFRASDDQAFRIRYVYFGESAGSDSIHMGYKNTPTRLNLVNYSGTETSAFSIPAGHSVTSAWTDIEINPTNNYLVTYSVANNGSKDSPAAWRDYNAGTNSASSTTRLTFISETASYTAAQLAKETQNWDSLSDTEGLNTLAPLYTIGLEEIQVCYSPTGSFTSQIVDTTLKPPSYERISYDADIPTGTALKFKVRTGDNPDMSDSSDWDDIEYSSLFSAGYKRYVQFQATLESDDDMLQTPRLKDVMVDWAGQTRLVNIGGTFSKGPNHGVFEISVDGKKLTSALVVDLEIYKDVLTMNNKTTRISSSQKVEISPRNTGF